MKSASVFALMAFVPTLASSSLAAPIRERTPVQQAARMHDPVIEAIEVADVPADVRETVLSRIGVGVGDALTETAKQKIGAEIRRVRTGMTFTYTPGSRPGAVKLLVESSC